MTKILIVDDESNMRFLLRMVLESEGFDVVDAPHGGVALERLRSGERPGVVVTDVMMPVMDGRELIGRLRADPDTAEIPIVVLVPARNVEIAGADAVVRAPFEIERLVDVVRGLAGEGEG